MTFTGFAAEDSLVLDYERAAKEIFPLLRSAGTDFLVGQYAVAFANILGNPGEFFPFVTGSHGDRDEKVEKLLDSFSHNLSLLVQKTWCSPEAVHDKAKIISDSEAFVTSFKAKHFPLARKAFVDLVKRLSTLIFGEIASEPDFIEWAFRIDPKLGLFSWFVQEMKETPPDAAADLLKTELLIGIYFLASL